MPSAAAIALEAEAKAGELLTRMQEAGERASSGKPTTARGINQPATLDDLGVTEHESRPGRRQERAGVNGINTCSRHVGRAWDRPQRVIDLAGPGGDRRINRARHG